MTTPAAHVTLPKDDLEASDLESGAAKTDSNFIGSNLDDDDRVTHADNGGKRILQVRRVTSCKRSDTGWIRGAHREEQGAVSHEERGAILNAALQ